FYPRPEGRGYSYCTILSLSQYNKNETAPVVQNENRKWKYIGSLKLNGQLDNVNLRDFAYE
ncbi:MAG: hypothetical protein COS14_11985, partial [Bacteroidetes bacterium CG02_land_8_20_14_3_00_31_25]